MRGEVLPFCFGKISALFCLLISFPVSAQVTPDKTLPINSQITQQGNITVIGGGTRAGTNLFHSLKDFSIGTGSTAYFNNASDIQNIITRVTGGSVSNIDGLIKANGTANLFLLNSNGIIFGQGAKLDIGGSFFACTASSLKFADGTVFNVKPAPTPLLTISIPIGLEFSNSTGSIQVQGAGNQITPNTLFLPSIANNSIGIEVEQGKTLALIGGNLNVEGGTLVAPGGRIELGSVGSGFVGLNSGSNQNWSLSYQGVTNFGNISVSKQALINSSGISAGSVQIYGNKISLTDGSVVLIQNQGETASGSLDVNAFTSLILKGASPNGNVSSSVLTEALSTGKSGDINISSQQLVLEDGARIGASTFSNAPGGNVTINAFDSVQMLENKAVNPLRQGNIISSIGSATFASGNAGDLQISTKKLLITNGGAVASSTMGAGKGGNTIVNANLISVIGTEPRRSAPSTIAASTFSTGQAGSVTINTSQLQLKDGGNVNSTSVTSGDGGNVTINAKDSIDVTGVASKFQPSFISSSVNLPSEIVRNIFRLPSEPPTGAGGNVIIHTPVLNVNQGGLVTVENQGTGNAGALTINANSLQLEDKGSITASSTSGAGGNIFLNTHDLQVRHSRITASAGNRGDGGNITINTDTLTTLEQSSITADAFEGKGGNIKIVTQGLFLSPDSKITATSEKGVNGTVDFITPGIDLLQSAAIIPPAVNTPKPTNICNSEESQATLVKTGTGGTPFNVSDSTTNNTAWNQQSATSSIQPSQPPRYVEARGWVLNPDGKTVRFVADPNNPDSQDSSSEPNCH